MSGSAFSDLLDRPTPELAARVLVAFGLALLLGTALGPSLLEALLPFHRHCLELFDDHYRVDLALTHLTGHDRIGGDLVVLATATVLRSFVAFGETARVVLLPGEALKCSTAVGLLMQPAVIVVGVLAAWPLRSAREAVLRWALGVVLLALWLAVGVPAWLWISLSDIPIRAVVPDELSILTALDKMLLDGGAVVLGALLGAAAVAAGRHPAGPRAISSPTGTT